MRFASRVHLAKVLGAGGIADLELATWGHRLHEHESTIRTACNGGSSIGTDTEAGSILGTPAYMPPEQATGDLSLLAPEAVDRPKDAGAVVDELTNDLEGVQDRLRPSEPAEAEMKARAVEVAKQRRLTLALLSTVLLAVALGGSGGAHPVDPRFSLPIDPTHLP